MSTRAYEPPSWWPDIEAAPYAHDLFHLLRRLDAYNASNPRLGRAWHPAGEPVRIGQQPSLAFAPASVADARTNDGERPRLSILGFGLFGPNGALPLHLTEFVRNRVRNHNDPVLNAFIDLFHHRLTLLFYRAWAQAQPTVNADREDDSAFDRYVASLTHLGLASIPRHHPLAGRAVHGVASRLVRRTRDAHGLQQILATQLRMPVRIVEWVPQWIALERRDRVLLSGAASNARLGGGAMIGAAVREAAGKFEIRVGPLTPEQFRALLPGSKAMNDLVAWVRTYIGCEFAWDLRLVIAARDIVPIRIGNSTPATTLGWGSWLGVRCRATAPKRRDPDCADDFVYSPEHYLSAGKAKRAGLEAARRASP